MSSVGIAVFMDLIEQVHVKPPKTIRCLDSMEELLWLIQPLSPNQHTTGIVVEGAIHPLQWQSAWDEMHRRYLALSASILKAPGQRPKFVSTGRPSPLNVRSLDERADLGEAIGDELGRSIGDGGHGLMRLTLYRGSERSLLLLTAHHSAADAKTSVFILEDLLASIAGETLTGEHRWPPPSSLLGQPKMAPYVRTSSNPEHHAPNGEGELPPSELSPVQVQHIAWTSTETTTLRS
jgi:hypothetical protein